MTSFLVLGVGPIGGIVGGLLVSGGHEVLFADTDAQTVTALRDEGLRLRLPGRDLDLEVHATTPDAITGQFETVLLAVPSSATEAALKGLAPHVGDSTIIVSMQNGLVAGRVARAVGALRSAGCAIRMGSHRVSPGEFATPFRGHLSLGHWREPATPRLEQLVATLDKVIDTDLSADIEAEMWSKLCHTSMVFFECLVDASLVETLRDSQARELFLGLMTEVVTVAEARGLQPLAMSDFDPNDFSAQRSLDERSAALDAWIEKMDPTSRKGAFRDIQAGRRTDVEEVLGVIAAEGREHSVPTPIALALLELVHRLEAGTMSMSAANYQSLAELAKRSAA